MPSEAFIHVYTPCKPNAPSTSPEPRSYQKKTDLFVILLLLIRLNGGLSNTVQISLARLCDSATSLVLILLKDTDLLECLEDLSVNGSGSVNVVGWARTTVAGGTVDFTKTTDTDGFAEVDVAGDRCGANVEPIDGLGWEFLCWAGLDGINPTCGQEVLAQGLWSPRGEWKIRTWDWEFSLSLQESSVCIDELLRLQHPIESASFRHQRSLRPPRACSGFVCLIYV